MFTEITEIVVLQTGEGQDILSFLAEYESLISSFPVPIRWFWLHGGANPHGDARFFVGDHFVDPIPLDLPLHNGSLRWIQDAFVVQHSTVDVPRLLVPSRGSNEDHALAVALAQRAGLLLDVASFHFEGGNILEVGDFVLIGKDVWLQNGVIDDCGNWDLERLASVKQRVAQCWPLHTVVWLGYHELRSFGGLEGMICPQSLQPLFHLDVQIMPLWIDASQLWMIVGEVVEPYLVGNWSSVEEEIWSIKEGLDLVASQIERAFQGRGKVIRIPLLLMVEGKKKALRILSHCNGYANYHPLGAEALLPDFLFELSLTNPHYGRVAKWQSAVVDCLRDAGVHSRFIQYPFYSSSQLGGALHCLTKVVRHKKIA